MILCEYAFWEKERKEIIIVYYSPLNEYLKDIKHPIPNKDDLLRRLKGCHTFSKFDLNSGFWQIAIHPKDRQKTTFVVPIGHYECIVMPFVLKNAPSEFQKGWMISLDPMSNFVLYI